MDNTQQKRAVRVGLGLRYQKSEADLYPVLGKLYAEGYLFAVDSGEDVWVATESLEGVELEKSPRGDTDSLRELGFTVYNLQEDGSLKEPL